MALPLVVKASELEKSQVSCSTIVLLNEMHDVCTTSEAGRTESESRG
jgi:hypothetical protein